MCIDHHEALRVSVLSKADRPPVSESHHAAFGTALSHHADRLTARPAEYRRMPRTRMQMVIKPQQTEDNSSTG
jgi:hypothetical protein